MLYSISLLNVDGGQKIQQVCARPMYYMPCPLRRLCVSLLPARVGSIMYAPWVEGLQSSDLRSTVMCVAYNQYVQSKRTKSTLVAVKGMETWYRVNGSIDLWHQWINVCLKRSWSDISDFLHFLGTKLSLLSCSPPIAYHVSVSHWPAWSRRR